MKLTEHRFGDWSDINYRLFTCPLPSDEDPPRFTRYDAILIMRFEGECGHGSGSASDCQFMRALTRAAVLLHRPKALVLDLSRLTFVWGELMWEFLNAGKEESADGKLPTAVVTSDRNRAGLSTMLESDKSEDPQAWLYETMSEAVAAAAKQIA